MQSLSVFFQMLEKSRSCKTERQNFCSWIYEEKLGFWRVWIFELFMLVFISYWIELTLKTIAMIIKEYQALDKWTGTSLSVIKPIMMTIDFPLTLWATKHKKLQSGTINFFYYQLKSPSWEKWKTKARKESVVAKGLVPESVIDEHPFRLS